jgi:hypothetical protein
MDEHPKASKRRVQLLWLIFGLIELAVYLLVKKFFDVNILLYLVGLNVLIAVVRIKKEPIFPARWGFRVALLCLFGVLVIGFYYSWQKVIGKDTKGLLGSIFVTKGYVRQVNEEVFRRLRLRLLPPESLYQWRETGLFDKEPVFARSTLAWLTYDSGTRRVQYRMLDSSLADLHVFDARLTASLDSALQKDGLIFGHLYSEQGRDYSIKGKLFKDEPRFVGTVMDVEAFNHKDLPEILTFAQENYPSLHLFTSEVAHYAGNRTGYTPLTLRFRDKDGSVLAQIGKPGEYDTKPVDKRMGFTLMAPDGMKPGVKVVHLEAIVPYSFEVVSQDYDRLFITAAFCLFIAALLAWVKAEIQLSNTKKELAEKDTASPTV